MFIRNCSVRNLGELSKNSFEFLGRLGDGAYGTVFKVRAKKSKNIYALKELKKSHVLKHSKQACVIREKDILNMLCEHDMFIQLECTFQDEDCLYFLMEYAENGTLDEYIKKRKRVPINACKFMVARLVLALEEMHKNNICHRDLKP